MGNWDFSGDEALFFLLAGVTAAVGFFRWYAWLLRRPGRGTHRAMRWLPPVCLGVLYLLIRLLADPKYVAGQLDYELLFMCGGAVALSLAMIWAAAMGVSARDDASERKNVAAVIAVWGAGLGTVLIYAGGNAGSGPTIWTTLLPATVALMLWGALWLVIELLSGVSDMICIDRDPSAGMRQAGYLLASGLVLGRSVAGDWTSWDSTWSDFVRQGWPVLLLASLAMGFHIGFRPNARAPKRDFVSAGLLPALIMIVVAGAYVALLGMPDIGKTVITYEQYMQGRR